MKSGPCAPKASKYRARLMHAHPYLSPLFTDLYELTMAAAYFERDMDAEATFSLFVRPVRPPAVRGYFVAAGLAEALHYLETLHFTAEDLAYLATTGLFY